MTEAQLLDGDAFNRLVVEQGLEGKTWEQSGYIYAGFRGKDGYELYRAYGPKWAYIMQQRRVVTQSAGGGGALTLRISCTHPFQIISIYAAGTASAGSAQQIRLFDEDGVAAGILCVVGAAANITSTLPAVGVAPTASNNSMMSLGLIVAPGQFLRFDASAALQTETLTVYFAIKLPIAATQASVTVDTTGSAGTPTLGGNTISAANAWQAVLIP